MKIIFVNDGSPIYKQITTQLKEKILNNVYKPGTKLPSIRKLAADLKISVITIKRVYADLETEGYIESFSGKGSFVSEKLTAQKKHESSLNIVKKKLTELLDQAEKINVTKSEIIKMIKDYGGVE